MPQSNYRTDWLCIATSGQAVDGRTIEAQWLIDAAETYTRDTYTALIWPHHPQYEYGEREFTCNFGEVDALKVESVDGVVKLYAQLIPNKFLIWANEDGQKLFTSAEFMGDFAGSGREYLMGIAVTDIPASLGTEKITFNLAGEEKAAERGNLETFSLGKLKTQKKETSFLGKLFSSRKEFTPTPQPNTDNNMPNEGEEQKMDELKALLLQMIQLLNDGQAAAEGDGDSDTPELAADEVAAIAVQIADAADEVSELAKDVADAPEDEVVAAEFSVAKAKLAAAIKVFSTKSATPFPSRRERRQFSARRQTTDKKNGNKDALTLLSAQLTDVMTKLSAQESHGTQRPNRAPGGSKEPFEFT